MGFLGDIAGAIIGGNAAKKAGKAQLQATQMAVDEQRRQYDTSRADMQPWQQAGGQAIGSLSAMLQPGYDHTTSPGYQFRFGEGQRAVEGSAASKGMLMSGGTLKDLTRFGQGIAADDFNQQFNRTASVAAGGQQANQSLGQLGANAATNIGNAQMQGGNARASGYVGQANAWINGINNAGNRLSSMIPGFGG